jgi:hypothetical protein
LSNINQNQNSIDDPKIIAEKFNINFVSKPKELSSNIPISKSVQFSTIDPNPNSFFIVPSTEQEVLNIIKSLKNSKA